MLEWYFTLLHFNLQDMQAYRLSYKFVLQLTPLRYAFQDDHDTKKTLKCDEVHHGIVGCLVVDRPV